MFKVFEIIQYILMAIVFIIVRLGNMVFSPVLVVAELPSFEQSMHSVSNYGQFNSKVWMEEHGNRLLFERQIEGFARKHRVIALIGDSDLKTILDLDDRKLLGAKDGYLYYTPFSNANLVYSFDLNSGHETELFHDSGRCALAYPYLLEIKDETYIALSVSNEHKYLKVQDGELIGIADVLPVYKAGNAEYYLGEDFVLYKRNAKGDQDEQVFDDSFAGPKISICPIKDGFIVYRPNSKNGLALIDQYGNSRVLYSFECYSCETSFAVTEKYVFYSVIRYSGFDHDEKVYTYYDDDTESGTYRIDLEDYSVTKICNEVYCGLYVFDNDSVFACDSKRDVYQLSVDGSTRKEIIGHRSITHLFD